MKERIVSEVDRALLAIVQIKPGLVGETRREPHMVRLANLDGLPESMTALCGEALRRDEVNQLDWSAQTPPPANLCMRCLVVNGAPGNPGLNAALNALRTASAEHSGIPFEF